MKNNTKISNILIAVGTFFIVSAVICFVYNFTQDKNADNFSGEIVSELTNEIPSHEENWKVYPFMDMPEKEIKGVKCIAILDIPALDLSLPVSSVWTDENLKIMPCRYSGSVYSDDIVIAGHNYRAHFGRINRLKQGDEITITDMDGNIFRYEVDVIDILEPTDIEEMKSGNWDLTFFTCNFSRSHRVTVRCLKAD